MICRRQLSRGKVLKNPPISYTHVLKTDIVPFWSRTTSEEVTEVHQLFSFLRGGRINPPSSPRSLRSAIVEGHLALSLVGAGNDDGRRSQPTRQGNNQRLHDMLDMGEARVECN